jgi:hypothetical protein
MRRTPRCGWRRASLAITTWNRPPNRRSVPTARLLDRYSWPLWLSTRKVGAELMQIRAEAPIVLSQLDPGAVRWVHALLDRRYIGRER